MTQNPVTRDYIMLFQYAEGGNLNYWINKNYKYFTWEFKLDALRNIIKGLKEIHQKQMIHCDFHPGNILLRNSIYLSDSFISGIGIYISDMGLSKEVSNLDETKIYGVTSYVAPEVLKGKPYT